MKTDIEIANSIEIKPIYEIADKLGIDRDLLEPYGRYKAKLPLSLIDKSKIDGKKLVLVSAISPTPAGEGKTTISIGLTEGLNRIGKQATVVLREPSLGPVFGIKGVGHPVRRRIRRRSVLHPGSDLRKLPEIPSDLLPSIQQLHLPVRKHGHGRKTGVDG